MTGSCSREQVAKLAKGAVLVVGDIMLDHYLIGDVERISPEAPVPVVNVQEESLYLGGAGNVAQNISALGGKALLVGVCGQDSAAGHLKEKLQQCGVEAILSELEDRPTTQKTRILARRQQMLRFDRERQVTVGGIALTQTIEAVAKLLPFAGSILISDYGKGLISKDLLYAIHNLIQKEGRSVPILVDPKPQNLICYSGVTLLTPNTKEACELSGLPTNNQSEILKAGRQIMSRLNVPQLVITLGADGMAVFNGTDDVWHLPTSAKEVFDVTGAGDTVIATTALGLACGLDLLSACAIANVAAGLVVAQVGTATASLDDILRILDNDYDISPVRWGH